MKLCKHILAVLLCATLLVSSAIGTTVQAEELIESVEGIRWFPVPENRRNDDAWEVECIADGCLCQRFTETAEDTGNTNYLDTEYTADGGLKLTRNDSTVIMGGIDYTERYWPRIRTISLETSPEFDMKTANTLYFDLEVAEGTEWNVTLAINGMVLGLGKFMAAAGGASLDPMDTSIVDAPAGSYKGSVNIMDVLDKVAADSNQLDNVNAQALKNMKKTFVPQLQIYVVGGIGSTLTVNELYITSAEDAAGEKCSFVDMGLLTGLGDEYYEDVDVTEEPAEDPDETPDDTLTIGTSPAEDDTDDTTEPTTAAKQDDKSDSAVAVTPILLIVPAVVIAVIVAIIVIVLKKKK